jgi:hypothetical protein
VLDGIDLIWADAGSFGIVTVRRQRVCVSSVAGSSLINKLGDHDVNIAVLGRHPS